MLTLAEVEQLTGLSREVLRKWALRYHFPTPVRGSRGERIFSTTEVRRLQNLAHLVADGHRPSAVVPLDAAQLQALLRSRPDRWPAAPKPEDVCHRAQALLALLASPMFADSLQDWLETQIKQVRLGPFLANVLPAFNQVVGDTWQAGKLPVHSEHLYTEAISRVVSRAMPNLIGDAEPPGVVMCTPPSELHALGLMALQGQLRLAGAQVINLGPQLPVCELLAAATAYHAQVVAVSISLSIDACKAGTYLQAVRADLPSDYTLWVGGAGCSKLPGSSLVGCEVFSDTSSAVRRWQQMSKEHRLMRMCAE